ncbi:MAG: hypothetical protein ACRDPW_08250 [Mycobacteriales bacterium]
MTVGWLYLAASVLAYGTGNFLQATAATRTVTPNTLHPNLLLRLAGHRSYVLGVLCQIVAFLLAFFAREELPLFLVQSSVAAGLGVTVLLGVVVFGWRLPRAELLVLAVLGLGLACLIISAQTSPSKPLSTPALVVLIGLVPVLALLGRLAARCRGTQASVALGSLAGVAFGAAAVVSRPLAGAQSLTDVVTNPLLYVLLAHAIVGQLLLGLALQHGSTTAAVAAMDAAAAIPAAATGLLLLGDKITPGLEPLAALGFVMTLGAVLALVRYAEPQQHTVEDSLTTLIPARAALPSKR